MIFLARIVDVSLNTLRIIFMLGGKKLTASVLGFFEALIWLLAISQIFQNLNNIPTYLAYASGFGTGVFVGMWIEEKLAIGFVVVRVITQKPADELIEFLKERRYRYSCIDAEDHEGKVNVLFAVAKRDVLPHLVNQIRYYNPNAVYTVEGVKKVSDPNVSGNPDSLRFRLKYFQKRG